MLKALENRNSALMLPDIEQDTFDCDKLKPRFDQRESELIGLTEASGEVTYQMREGHYTEHNASFNVNSRGLLQRYPWQENEQNL